MTTLALSTSSPALSIALVDGLHVLARRHEVIGRGHAEALVPAIAALLRGRRADAIIVDVGPGSYTGIRIGIAAARALGLAWGVPVQGVSACALVAAQAFAGDPELTRVLALIDAGRGHAAGALVGRDLVVTAPVLVNSAPPGVAVAGAGAGLIAGVSPRHRDHPDSGLAGHVHAAALVPPLALYAGD